MLQLLYFSLMTKLSTLPFFFKFYKHLNRNILLYLLIYCLVQQRVYQSWVHDLEELLDIWHALQLSAVDSAIDGERVFTPAYGPKEEILSSDNMLIEWEVIEAVKQCSKFVQCVFQIG